VRAAAVSAGTRWTLSSSSSSSRKQAQCQGLMAVDVSSQSQQQPQEQQQQQQQPRLRSSWRASVPAGRTPAWALWPPRCWSGARTGTAPSTCCGCCWAATAACRGAGSGGRGWPSTWSTWGGPGTRWRCGWWLRLSGAHRHWRTHEAPPARARATQPHTTRSNTRLTTPAGCGGGAGGRLGAWR
jgi:hypothetical protein